MAMGNFKISGYIIPVDFAQKVLQACPDNPAFPILLKANHIEAVCTLLKAVAIEARKRVPVFAAVPTAGDGDSWTSGDDYVLWLEQLDALHQEAKELLDDFYEDSTL